MIFKLNHMLRKILVSIISFCVIYGSCSIAWAMGEIEEIDVAVVGGGFSGLSTAYKILQDQPRKKVKVFEGRDRLGGRAYTLSVNGAPVEAGGEFIDPDHEELLTLIKTFSLQIQGNRLQDPLIAFKEGCTISLEELEKIITSLNVKISILRDFLTGKRESKIPKEHLSGASASMSIIESGEEAAEISETFHTDQRSYKGLYVKISTLRDFLTDKKESEIPKEHLSGASTSLSVIKSGEKAIEISETYKGLFENLILAPDERALLHTLIRDNLGIDGDQEILANVDLWQEIVEEYKALIDTKRGSPIFSHDDYDQYEGFCLKEQNFLELFKYRIVGGTQILVNALKDTIGENNIELNASLTHLSWNDQKRLFNLRFGSGIEIQAKSVVMTLPFSVLRKTSGILDDTSLGIRSDLRTLIDEMSYATYNKIIYPTSSPIYLTSVFDLTHGVTAWANGEKSLTVPLGGTIGEELTEDHDLVEILQKEFLPELNTSLQDHPIVVNWAKDPFNLGSFRAFTKNCSLTKFDTQSPLAINLYAFATELYEKGVPLIFAGEHTCFDDTGYMNSAIKTGFAAAEILKK